MKNLVIVFSLSLIFELSAQEKHSENNYYNILDSLYTSLNIDTTENYKILLSPCLEDRLNFQSSFDGNKNCLDIFYLMPRVVISFPTFEYDQLLNNDKTREEDYFRFLQDNDVIGTLWRLSVNKSGELIKIEQLSIDVNVNFGEVISTAYYKNNLLVLFYNNYCYKVDKNVEVRSFEYISTKIVVEKIWYSENSKIFYKEKKF